MRGGGSRGMGNWRGGVGVGGDGARGGGWECGVAGRSYELVS